MYYTVIKNSIYLRTLGKCRKHSPAARAFYISLVFSNACRVLSQCKTRLRLLYLLNIVMVRGFGPSEPARQRTQQGIANLTRKRHREKDPGVLSLTRERSKPRENKAPPHLTVTATQRNAANEHMNQEKMTLSPHFLLMNQVNQHMNKVNQHINGDTGGPSHPFRK